MCYPAPGPRCSNHARHRLTKAQTLLSNTSPHDVDSYLSAKAHHEKVLIEWSSSPEGIRELTRSGRMAEARAGRNLRNAQLAAYRKRALDRATNTKTSISDLNSLLRDRSVGKEARRGAALNLAKKHPVWSAFGDHNKTADMLLGVPA